MAPASFHLLISPSSLALLQHADMQTMSVAVVERNMGALPSSRRARVADDRLELFLLSEGPHTRVSPNLGLKLPVSNCRIWFCLLLVAATWMMTVQQGPLSGL